MRICLIFLTLFFKSSYSAHKLIRLSAIDITQQLEHSPKSIVFVSDNEKSIEFAYSAIEKYKNQVKFFLTSPSEVPSSFYKTDPSIIAFQFTRPWPIESPPLDSTSFSYWVQRIIDPTHYIIALPQQLEKVLEGPAPALFEIDGDNSNVQKITESEEITVFKSRSSLFQTFYPKIQPGLYAYRPQNKQMIPYNGSFSLQIFSRLTHYSMIEKNSNKVIIAFIIDEWGDKSTKQYELLENLSDFYGNDTYYYTLIDTPNTQKIFNGLGIYGIKRPVFVVSNISSDPPQRWIYNETSDNELNLDSLKKFVSEIISNQRIPTIISEPVPNYTETISSAVQPIVNSNFADLVYDDTCETVVMFVHNNNQKSKIAFILFRAIANILHSKYVKFYYFNVTLNDIPQDVPKISTYPIVIMWPAGIKDKPNVYHGNVTFQEVFNFVKGCASHKLAIPKFDLKRVLSSITDNINKLKKKDKNDDL